MLPHWAYWTVAISVDEAATPEHPLGVVMAAAPANAQPIAAPK